MVNLIKKYFFVCIVMRCVGLTGYVHAMHQDAAVVEAVGYDRVPMRAEVLVSEDEQKENENGGIVQEALFCKKQKKLGELLLAYLGRRHGMNVSKDERVRSVDEFIAQGAPVNCRSRGGRTPLMLAINYGWPEYIQNKLLAAGACVDMQDPEAINSLLHASFNGHVGIIKVLIAAGVDINREVDWCYRYTPLMVASSPQMIQVLVDAGACIDAQNCYDRTALHESIEMAYKFVTLRRQGPLLQRGVSGGKRKLDNIEMLIWLGAHYDIPDENGDTAWDRADDEIKALIKQVEQERELAKQLAEQLAEQKYAFIAHASELDVGLWDSMPSVVRVLTGEYVREIEYFRDRDSFKKRNILEDGDSFRDRGRNILGDRDRDNVRGAGTDQCVSHCISRVCMKEKQDCGEREERPDIDLSSAQSGLVYGRLSTVHEETHAESRQARQDELTQEDRHNINVMDEQVNRDSYSCGLGGAGRCHCMVC